MLKGLGIAIHRLAPSHLLIQGFHQSRQRSPGIVRLELKIEEWEDTRPLYLYVIDAETSNNVLNVLLGRRWMHDNCVVPSPMFQVNQRW